MIETGLSYDDVNLIPKYSDIESRTHVWVDTKLSRNITMNIPILAANMDTIIGTELAEILIGNGSVPIFHRFLTAENATDYAEMIQLYGEKGVYSLGVGDAVVDLLRAMRSDGVKPMGFCVDIAHGHSKSVFETIGMIKKHFPNADVIAGNVCSGRAVHDLVNAGADAVKVGIGPGSVCTTRNVTAFGRAQFSAVQECASVGQDLQVPIIADGGIKSSREVILALAAGASSVMVGGLFATTHEAAGKGNFRGQASASFQEDFYGRVKEGTVPEGISTEVEQTQPAQKLINDLVGGLRSGMTLGGARSISELQRKAQFERTTPSYF